MNKKGITLMEVLVSAIIFALILVGMVNLFVAGRRYIMYSRAKMTATELGKYFLEPFQQQVRGDQWGQADHCLSTGTGCQTPTHTINNVDYTATYEVSEGPGGTNATDVRRVTTTITWQEFTP